MLSVLDPLLGTFFELLKNKFLTWIASGGTKVDESRKLGVVVSGKFGYSGRLRAPAMHGVSSNNTNRGVPKTPSENSTICKCMEHSEIVF